MINCKNTALKGLCLFHAASPLPSDFNQAALDDACKCTESAAWYADSLHLFGAHRGADGSVHTSRNEPRSFMQRSNHTKLNMVEGFLFFCFLTYWTLWNSDWSPGFHLNVININKKNSNNKIFEFIIQLYGKTLCILSWKGETRNHLKDAKRSRRW